MTINNITFNSKEPLLNTAKKGAQKALNDATHEYKSNSMLGIVEKNAEKLSEKNNEYIESVRAKYAPFSTNTKNSEEIEKLTEEYKRSHGSV